MRLVKVCGGWAGIVLAVARGIFKLRYGSQLGERSPFNSCAAAFRHIGKSRVLLSRRHPPRPYRPNL